MVSESRYRIPEGPPVPIPNTEVKLRRAENTLPVTAREDRSAPTFGFRLQRRAKKREKGTEQLRNGSFPKRRKRIKSFGFFRFYSSAFSPLDLVLSEYEVRLRNEIKGSASEAVCQSTPNGGVAQLGEHLPCKQGVMGSNPIIST